MAAIVPPPTGAMNFWKFSTKKGGNKDSSTRTCQKYIEY